MGSCESADYGECESDDSCEYTTLLDAGRERRADAQMNDLLSGEQVAYTYDSYMICTLAEGGCSMPVEPPE